MKTNEQIKLSKNEKIWVLLCKGWIMKKYPINKSQTFLEYIEPYFSEVYGWTAEDFKHDFQRCVFNVLFDIFMKIRENYQNDSDLKDIISSGCYSYLGNDSEEPIQRVIQKIKGEIACNAVRYTDGSLRYDLDEYLELFINTDN